MPAHAPSREPPPGTRALIIAALVVMFIVILAAVSSLSTGSRRADTYSVGYQIGPHYVGFSTWEGTPYALSAQREGEAACPPPARVTERGAAPHKDTFYPFAPPDDGPRGTTDPPSLVYSREDANFPNELRGSHPDWWRPDGGTYGLPVAADRPDFWAGDATIHTYHARDPIPPLCDPADVAENRRRLTPEEWDEKWRYYGGPKGWNMSPFY